MESSRQKVPRGCSSEPRFGALPPAAATSLFHRISNRDNKISPRNIFNLHCSHHCVGQIEFNSTIKQQTMQISTVLLALAMCLSQTVAFSPVAQRAQHTSIIGHQQRTPTILRMTETGGGEGGMEKAKDKKKSLSTIVIDKTDTEMQEDETPEEQWRVVLHNDEVHTFNYVIRSLQKVMGTLDKKKAFDICTVTHGQGQATVETCWKAQAMKYCLGLQRQGLTASIAPDGKFEGGDDGDGGGPESG